MSDKQKNVLGEDLEECSNNPLTGWYRDGCCNTDENDHGVHTVCAKVTTEFLEWLKVAGNDLITPHPEYGFPGQEIHTQDVVLLNHCLQLLTILKIQL